MANWPSRALLAALLALALLRAATGVRVTREGALGLQSESADGLPAASDATSGPASARQQQQETQWLPIVLWHGMGDSCCSEGSMGTVKAAIEAELPGVFVHSDVFSSYWGNSNDQVERVCQELAAMPQLSSGFAAVGFSQGSQLLRAVVQRCQHLLPGGGARVLVSMGGQHQGVMQLPGCVAPGSGPNGTAGPGIFCRAMEALLSWGAYAPMVQRHVIQAQYFKDPYRLPQYRVASIFLADINLESSDVDGDAASASALAAVAARRSGGSSRRQAAPGVSRGSRVRQAAEAAGRSGAAMQQVAAAAAAAERNTLYRDNLASLQRLVLYQFGADDMVVPKESSHFGVYSASQKRLLRMEETSLYRQDRIGLKALDDSGRLELLTAPGRHMQIGLSWFRREVVRRWLALPAEPADVQ